MAIKTRLLLAMLLIICFSHSLYAKSRKKTDAENGLKQISSETNNLPDKAAGNAPVAESRESLETDENSLQDAEESAEKSAEEKWQYLEWEEENPEFVLNYEVVIEALEEKKGTYTEINRLQTETNTTYIQVKPLLPPGNYRYKVITYNLIGIAEVESDWFEFRIFKAFQPEISNISATVNHSSTLFLEEINNGIFNITGKNLFEEPQSKTDISFTTYALERQKKKNAIPLVPQILEYDDKNRHLKVQFNMKELDVGTYNFIAMDASGLKNPADKKNEITVKFKKRVDFDISGGYTLPVILFDDTIKNYMGSNVWPLSLTARLSLMPFKHSFGYFGLGLTGSYTRMFSNFDSYSVDGNLITSHALFVYQLPVRTKIKNSDSRKHIMTLELHGGPGFTFFNDFKFHFDHNINSDPLNSLNISINAGFAAQIYITNRLYTEIGADYIMAFVSDMGFGMLEPEISIGWQF